MSENVQIFYSLIIYRNELKYFNRMTTTVNDSSKRNCVIMGRKTYVGIPPSKRPLPNRLNIVLSTTTSANDYPDDVILCKSLPEALSQISTTNIGNDIENIWIVGGNNVYKEAMLSQNCHRVYLTKIMANYECDAFFPTINSDFEVVANPADIPSEVQEENGIQYRYTIYEKKQQE